MQESYREDETEREEEWQEDRASGRGWIIFACVAVGLLGIAALALFAFKTETIRFESTGLYSEEELTQLLLEPEYSDNSLYFWFYYKYRYGGEIPFIDEVDVKITGLKSVKVGVREKELTGLAAYSDAYLYFDQEGRIAEISTQLLPGLTVLEGFEFDVAEKGEMLPAQSPNQLKSALLVLSNAKRLGIPADRLVIQENGTMVLFSGTIEVRLGLGQDIEEKMSLTGVLLNTLAGKSGILHMEDYDGTNGTRSFEETGI